MILTDAKLFPVDASTFKRFFGGLINLNSNMEKSENDSVEDKIDQGHSENVNEQKPDNSSTNKDEDRWEDKLNEAYGKQDDLQNRN